MISPCCVCVSTFTSLIFSMRSVPHQRKADDQFFPECPDQNNDTRLKVNYTSTNLSEIPTEHYDVHISVK
jgi:hypothetical protein